MPYKVRFLLEGEPPSNPFQHVKGLQAVILDWIGKASAELATTLHDANQPKPYTISPLCAVAGMTTKCCFDVSFLADWLIELLLEGKDQCTPDFRLGYQLFQLCEWKIQASATWNELLMPPPEGLLGFEFRLLSPTAHHAKGPLRKCIVLPSPELYFGSWFSRWHLCCPIPLYSTVLDVVADQVGISTCSGGTHNVALGRNRHFIGFEGTVGFTILRPETLTAEALTSLAALARFASFCGTGVETMRGMGQTELVALRT